MRFDTCRARRKLHLLSTLQFYLPFIITYSDDELNQSSVKTVDIRIFAFDPYLLFVVPKAALGQRFPECRYFGSPTVHSFTVMHLPGMQIYGTCVHLLCDGC
jgi:hypothetical protein